MQDAVIKTLPLATADIIGFFENPDHFFFVDYNNSNLKKESFLTYIANMKMKCDLHDYKSISFEDRKELLTTYINFLYVIEMPALKHALASVLLHTRSHELIFDYFSEEEANIFISENKEKLDTIANFFDSMLVVGPSMSNEFRAEIFDKLIEDKQLETVEDPSIIGINVFTLIAYPHFMDMFIGLGKEVGNLKYYKYAIENFVYDNKKFYQILTELNPPSFLMSVFNLLTAEGGEEEKFFEDLRKGTDDATPN